MIDKAQEKSRKVPILFVVVFLAILTSLVTSIVIVRATATGISGANSSVEKDLKQRVIGSGKIRCAYISYAPGTIMNPNTEELSGIFPEVLSKAGELLDLEIVWTEEVNWATMIEGLESKRYDVVAYVWPNPSRAKRADFSLPLFYSGVGVYVRTEDKRFDLDLNKINSSDVRIAWIDGEMAQAIAQEQFPNAKPISLPQTTDISQVLLNVTSNKADVTFVETYQAQKFLRSNPGQLRNICKKNPIRIFGNCIMFLEGEEEFKAMINTTIDQLINSGYVDRVIDKYEEFPGALYRPRLPYRQ